MKKRDLKKLALLGLTGGVMLTTQGTVEAEIASSPSDGILFAAGGCGANKCSGEGRPMTNKRSGCGAQNKIAGCGASTPIRSNSCNASGNIAGCGASSNKSHACGSIAGCGSSCHAVIAEAEKSVDMSSGQLMTESQLMSQLNNEGKRIYNSLSPEGKAMAIKLASRSCKGTNDCKGQNACKSDDHSCAGKGSCAGSSTCSFKDKNQAVKVAAQKQAEKRAKTNSGSY